MNNEYLERAKEVIPDVKTLIVLASKRARQLAHGARPTVRCKEENHLDVALLEIAEGKIEASFDGSGSDNFLQELEAAKVAAAAKNGEKSAPAKEK